MRFIKILFLSCILIVSAISAQAQTVIRDTEIENILKEWSEPIYKAGNIPPENVNMIVLQSPQINAFVAGGSNIFLYTGLILRTETPEELMGVIAHELGHIAGGHLIAKHDQLERASYESIIGLVLGIGAAIATGDSRAAAVVSSGAQNTALRRFLAHSRIHESSADQAAVTYLDKAGINPEGLQTFFAKLQSEELLPSSQQSEYVRTHPITANRMEALQTRVDQSPHKGKQSSVRIRNQHARMKAKLLGFIHPEQVPWFISDHDKSIPAQYARAIAKYRQGYEDEAIQGMDRLIAAEPKNPYFRELKGQILVDFSRIEDAIPEYRKALELKNDAPLIQIAYSHALLQSRNRDQYLDEAIRNLNKALVEEPRSARAQRLIATAYGRQGKDSFAKLHLAEEAALQRRFPYAKRLAQQAYDQLPDESREKIKAKDLLTYIENNNKAP